MSRRRSFPLLGFFCLLPAILPAIALAEAMGPGVSAGHLMFSTYCASCHGIRGEGDGPAAGALLVTPPNLTLLGDRYGMPLPLDAVAGFIDGRRDVAAHGPRGMPVWGEILFKDEIVDTSDLEGAKRRTIYIILDFLQSIQRVQGT